MKNRLVVLSAVAVCLLSVVFARSTRAADPGPRYADAFVLIEQGQTAEEKSDLATAYHKYEAALNTLHTIRTDSPDWNAQMVDYRLKDCQSRFDAVKAKLPEPPPAPAAPEATAPVVTPVVQVPAPPPMPAPVATPPPAPVEKSVFSDQSAKLKAQLDKLEAENHQLKSDLADAKHAAAEKKAATLKPVPVPADSGEARKLRAELADSHAEIDRLKKAAAKPAPTAKAPTEPSQNFGVGSSTVVASPAVAAPAPASADVKKLRAELDKSRGEADAAKKSAAQVADLQKQNKDLSTQLAAAEKKAVAAKLAAPAPAPADTAELKKLRADLADARAESDKAKKASADLGKKNSDLSAQLAGAKKEAPTKPVVASDSAELKKLRADLDTARADAAAQAKKSASQVADLEKQNKDLSTKLASTEKKSNIAPVDSGEVKNLRSELDKAHAEVADLKKQVAAKPGVAPVADNGEVKSLRTQLADTRKELDQTKKSASQVSDLEKQNKDLSAKLAASEKKAAAKPVPAPVDNSAELKKLHEELDSARTDADKGKKAAARASELEKENKDLSAKLVAEKKADASAPSEAPDARVMKHLRSENSYLRNVLDTYAEQNSELKGQLRRHDQNQSKSSE